MKNPANFKNEANTTNFIKLYMIYQHTNVTSHGLVCVISVSLPMSVITQDGDSAMMMAAREGSIEVISLILEAEARIHQNKVKRQ